MQTTLSDSHRQLVEEIIQVKGQFRDQFPGRNRAYPVLIRERVRTLAREGLALKKIADLTQISYDTVLNWFPKSPRSPEAKQNFQQVRLVEKLPQSEPPNITDTVTVPIKAGTVTVTTPSGYKIGFSTFESAQKFFEEFLR